MSKNSERIFRFKHFSVKHSRSSMPIGVDGVLVGSWATKNIENAEDIKRVMDIGTGCGVIALIAAQRLPSASVTAIDIDKDSCEEAEENFCESEWQDRLTCINVSLQDYIAGNEIEKMDLIISNPPFFISGIDNPTTSRERARHEASLPLEELALCVSVLLKDNGRFGLILPHGEVEKLFISKALKHGLRLIRKSTVRGFSHKLPKRSLLLFSKGVEAGKCYEDEIVLEVKPGEPTEQYRELCNDLYLKF